MGGRLPLKRTPPPLPYYTNKPCMLQLYPVYLSWNRRKTLTGSPDPTRMQTVQINLAQLIVAQLVVKKRYLEVDPYLLILINWNSYYWLALLTENRMSTNYTWLILVAVITEITWKGSEPPPPLRLNTAAIESKSYSSQNNCLRLISLSKFTCWLFVVRFVWLWKLRWWTQTLGQVEKNLTGCIVYLSSLALKKKPIHS